jgi:hypothetical protein
LKDELTMARYLIPCFLAFVASSVLLLRLGTVCLRSARIEDLKRLQEDNRLLSTKVQAMSAELAAMNSNRGSLTGGLEAKCYRPNSIAIALSVTSRGTDMKKASESPVFDILFPSLNRTASRSGDYSYIIYVGFDKGDPLYDWDIGQTDFRARFDKQFGAFGRRTKPMLIMQAFTGTDHAPSWVICNLMKMAYNDGAEYLFQVNDDSELVDPGWERVLTEALKTNPTWPNFGAAGPMDKKWGGGAGQYGADVLLTHAFTHRTHLDIHGRFFPWSFRNWWSDNWITSVYGANDTFVGPKGVVVEHQTKLNKKDAKEHRYKVNSNDAKMLPTELKIGRKRIDAWVESGRIERAPKCHLR